MSSTALHFKISSGLKSIIGGDLISDDFIAVFELVKNSYDAHASKVKIIFENDKIVIWDDGKGMDYDELVNKWLHVAYSAKKEGEEDEELTLDTFSDYRNKIAPAKYYAGAKGIGRFSSDRLGKMLNLVTKKAHKGSKTEQLEINWGNFEKNPQVKFEKINIKYIPDSVLTEYPKFSNGTILKITSLRSKWPRKKIQELKRSLEKLINPFDIIDEATNSKHSSSIRKFNIIIEAQAEIEEDNREEDKKDKVNGPVQNFIFNALNVKTTQIFTEISADGKKIETELFDRGKSIYKVSENNPYKSLLSNIRFHLYYLNTAAKLKFKKQMGISSIEFGSVFLYKNGFRVYPFGEPGKDLLGIDLRKQQGQKRYLGSREIVGRIEIYGNDEDFKETSSRDGGLKITQSYLDLEDCFSEKCLKRLERYVVDIQWTLKDDKEDTSLIEKNIDAKSKIASIIMKLANSSKISLESYDKEILKIVDVKLTDNNVDKAFYNLEKLAYKTNEKIFFDEINDAKEKYEKLKKEKDEAQRKEREHLEARLKAEEEKRKAEQERKIAEEAYQQERKKNLFFNATGRDNNKATLGLIHHIKLTSKALDSRIKILTKDIINNKIDINKTLEILSEIKVQSSKILKLSEIVTYSDLNFKFAKHSGDLVRFIVEYIAEIKPGFPNVEFHINTNNISKEINFSILEISIILDNLISNSIKSSNNNTIIQLDFYEDDDGLHIIFSDSGDGVDTGGQKHLFDLGFTTTRGSGIGLYTVKDLMKQNKGDIHFFGNGKVLNGASFELLF